MAKRKRRFAGSVESHGAMAKQIARETRKQFKDARSALVRANKATGTKKQSLCAAALDSMMSGNAAKAAMYRERAWSRSNARSRMGTSANRVSESLKHRFRQVCLKHKKTSRTGHW